MNFSFYLSFFSFALFNLIALFNAWVWSRALRKFEKKPALEIIFETATLFLSEIIVLETGLGIIGRLSFFSTGACLLFLFAINIFAFHQKIINDLKNFHIHYQKGEFPWLTAIFFLAVPIIITVLRLFHTTLQVPLDYDSVTYHLPFAVEWFKSGSLWQIFYNPFLGPVGYYAGNFELLLVWKLFAFGRDYFVNFINYSFLILSGLVLYQIGKNEGMGKTAKFFMIAIALSQPLIFILLGSQLVELFIALTFLLTFYFLREFQRDRSLSSIIFIGLAAGLLIGSKFTGILYTAPLLMAACWSLGAEWKKQKKDAMAGKKLLCLIIAIFVTSGFWYIRNWIDIGSPLYPVEIPFITHLPKVQGAAQDTLLEGTSLAATIKTVDQFNEFLFYFVKRTGGQWLLILIAIALGLKEVIIFKKNDKQRFFTFSLLIGSIIYFLLYWFMPYTGDPNVMIHNIRFALPFVLFSFLTAIHLLEKIRLPSYIYILGALAAFFYNLNFTYFKSAQNPLFNDFINIDLNFIKEQFWIFLFFLIMLSVLCWFVSLLFSNKKPLAKAGGLIMIMIILALYFGKTLPLREDLRINTYISWHQGDTNSLQWIEAAEWLNHNVGPAHIALTGFTYSYPLYGRALERTVDYININNCQNCRTSDYLKKQSDSRLEADYESWLKNLQAKKIDYVIIDKKTFNDIYEYYWAENHKDQFEEVHQNNLVSIFHLTQH